MGRMPERYKPGLAFHVLTPLYDRLTDLLGFGRTFKVRTLDALPLRDGESLLDVGCGTGTLLAALAARFPRVRLAGIDADARMLGRAAGKLGGHSRVALLRAYAQALPFPDGAFDVVVSTLIFHHLPTAVKRQVIREITRVLRPGGRFLLADFGPPDTAVQRVLLGIVGRFDGAANMRANLAGELPGMLQDAGLAVREAAPRYRAVQFLLASK